LVRSLPVEGETLARDSLARATAATQRRYDRLAPSYDRMMDFMERRAMSRWRRLLWSRVPVGRGLEVGIGTGANMPYYPRGASVAAVDISPRMLQRARERSKGLGLGIDLGLMTAEALAFPDRSFDWVVATFVFCSVPDPVAGLRELGRVCRSEGTILLLEHVRIDRPVIGTLMDLLSPLAVRIGGEHINRRTVENVRRAGLDVVAVEDLGPMGLVKLITARPLSC
jgi:ubiquinone/menaquinone biosynthesis C-methylase UbiE